MTYWIEWRRQEKRNIQTYKVNILCIYTYRGTWWSYEDAWERRSESGEGREEEEVGGRDVEERISREREQEVEWSKVLSQGRVKQYGRRSRRLLVKESIINFNIN
jgi:hypothetical protein